MRQNAFVFANLKAAIEGVRQYEIINTVNKEIDNTANKNSVSTLSKKVCARDSRSQNRHKKTEASSHSLRGNLSVKSTGKGPILTSKVSFNDQYSNQVNHNDFDFLDNFPDGDDTETMDTALSEHQEEDLLVKPYPSTLSEKIVEENSESDSTNTEEDLQNVTSS